MLKKKTMSTVCLFFSACVLHGCVTSSEGKKAPKTPEADWSNCVKSLPGGKESAIEPYPRTKERTKIVATNRVFSSSSGLWQVGYMDIGSQFLEEDGTISHELMGDSVHPAAEGYRIWAAAIEDSMSQK